MEQKLSPFQQEFIRDNAIVVLATVTNHTIPRAIFVAVNDVKEDQLIITDKQMYTTTQNLLDNPEVCILVSDQKYSFFLQIRGTVDYYIDGEYFDYVQKLPGNVGYEPKGAIVVKITKIQEGK
jgi:uncharacterized pyridoxamine 5'-phosphate oxidase family protein